MPRYPQIHVATRSANPLTLVAAVRQQLRRAGVSPGEIHRFSQEALTARDPVRACRRWVDAKTVRAERLDG